MGNATTQEKSARPLGVIGSLAAGFEMIGRHLWLILWPLVLDLLLWLGPRLSVAPLFEQFCGFLLARPAPDPTTARQVAQAVELLGQLGERFNLLSLLSVVPLLNVPSLLAQRPPGAVSPLGEPAIQAITNPLALMGWLAVLCPVGLALGFLYLSGLARRVRAVRSDRHQAQGPHRVRGSRPDVEGQGVAEGAPANQVERWTSGGEGSVRAVRVFSGLVKLIRVFLFAGSLVAVGMVLVPIWMLIVGGVLALVPPLGFLVWSLGIGLGSYMVLHLLFVVPGVLVGDRGLVQAVWESILLIHTQFPAVVGLVLLVVIIYQGMGFIWSLPSAESWSLAVGILGNACIASGVTAALFVFYQERIGKLAEAGRLSASA